MSKIKISIIFLIFYLNLCLIGFSNTLKNHYILLNSQENYEYARLNRAKLSTLSNAKIVILSPKKIVTKNTKRTPRTIQKEKLIEHFYIYRKIKQKEPLENKENYSVLLGPENKKRVDKLSKILTNLKYANFHIVTYQGNLNNKKKEDSNFLTIDPKDFNLPIIKQEKILPISN